MDLSPAAWVAGDAERHGGARRIEAQKPRAGGGGAEAAHRRGGVKAQRVMARRHQQADAADRLVAGDEGGDELAPARALGLAERQQRRHQVTVGWPI